MGFEYHSKMEFLRMQISESLQFVQESNRDVAIGDQLSKVGKVLCPIFQDPSKELKFSTDYLSTIGTSGWGKPGISNLINTSRMVKPIIFKPENVSPGNICANLNLTRQMIRSNLG